MFHKATESLAKQLDPEGDFIPVRCLLDQSHFGPLCLVQKKQKEPWWWRKRRYYKTDYKLCDILSPGQHTSQPDICDSDAYSIVDHVDGSIVGDVTAVTDLTSVEIQGSASVSHARSVKVKKRHIGPQVLDSLNGKGRINLDHQLIQQCKTFQRDLYVICETVETVEAAEFRHSSKTEGSIFAELRLKTRFEGRTDSKKAVVVPKSCTLAFRVKRLVIRDATLSISVLADDQRKTFEESTDSLAMRMARITTDQVFMPSEKCQLMEIKEECAPFLSLSIDLCGKFFKGFLAVIRNNDLLQELELQLEQTLDGINQTKLKTSRPELQELVNNLQDSTGSVCPDIAGSVLYFLQALDELSESELSLLEESVERRIVPKQAALVQRILEEDGSDRKGKLVEIQDVSPFTEDELDVTVAMIKSCGMTVDRSIAGLRVTGNPNAYLALSALYVALYVLNILSK